MWGLQCMRLLQYLLMLQPRELQTRRGGQAADKASMHRCSPVPAWCCSSGQQCAAVDASCQCAVLCQPVEGHQQWQHLGSSSLGSSTALQPHQCMGPMCHQS